MFIIRALGSVFACICVFTALGANTDFQTKVLVMMAGAVFAILSLQRD